ncbi:polysaccharide pyruvyl transferase family protein [Sphingobium phenoxybenzoativorans]|uniref:Polysaccharide pyruvyl transferase family protein n=1 Tax=Sphingobium phenoxybenzoativorans TaxID=1592790 RepID=A0A975K781_9SPHN|nr:polysaccharide pyruvyl transferase family protein [Sphingobium phenoxybenzoativorans]QUT05659.1 polysaccharide pyruvyl transferase family protein [Sphingobium phenoxybenzoativorans]
MSAPHIALLTRMTTQNAGNEALSIELMHFLGRLVPTATVRALDRYPRYLEQFKMSAMKGNDAFAAFDDIAKHLISRFKRDGVALAPLAEESLVRLDQSARELQGLARRLKRKIGLRRNLARFPKIGGPALSSTIGTLDWADLLVWNPAGEFHPTGSVDEVYRLLLLVRIAQLLGTKTAIVNHSLEINDPRLADVVAGVYAASDYVGVRDATSVKVVADLGINPSRIFEAPDLVFLASRDASQSPRDRNNVVGFAINGLEASKDDREWDILFRGLKSHALDFVYLSNAMNHDLELATKLAAKYGGTVIDRQPTYRELRRLFGNLSVLVSSRLHSSILSLAEETPVVSIEPSLFKLTAIFEQMRYPISTDSFKSAGWGKRLCTEILGAVRDRDDLVSTGNVALQSQLKEIEASYAPLANLLR